MARKLLLTALSCVALGISSTAIAQAGGGGGGGGPGGGGGGGGGVGVGGGGSGGGMGGMGGGMGAGGGFGVGGSGAGGGFGSATGGSGSGGGSGLGNGNGNGNIGADVRDAARANSQAAERAALVAIERANPNSVLATAVTGGPLDGLQVGMIVVGPDGATLGAVQRIVAKPDGTIILVLVKSANGERIIPVAPGSLTIEGSTAVAATFPGNVG